MAIKPALTQFNGGEISPQLEGRFDWDKYNYSAKLCKNFIPTVEGSLKRRGGTHFVAVLEGGFYKHFSFVINGTNNKPTLRINGKEMALTQENSGNYVYKSEVLNYLLDETVNYSVACSGFDTISGTMVLDNDFEDYKVIQINFVSQPTIKLKILAYQGASVYLNDVVRNELYVHYGEVVNCKIVDSAGLVNTGTITINSESNITLVAYKVGDSFLGLTASQLVDVSVGSTNYVKLPAAKYRIIGVGGGGGAFYKLVDWWNNGRSGAAFSAVFNLLAGTYNYKVGACGTFHEMDNSSETIKKCYGEDTYIKYNNSTFATAEGGKTGGGENAKNTISQTYLQRVVFNTNGGVEDSYTSVYGGYGAGQYMDNLDENRLIVHRGTDGYLAIFFEGE